MSCQVFSLGPNNYRNIQSRYMHKYPLPDLCRVSLAYPTVACWKLSFKCDNMPPQALFLVFKSASDDSSCAEQTPHGHSWSNESSSPSVAPPALLFSRHCSNRNLNAVSLPWQRVQCAAFLRDGKIHLPVWAAHVQRASWAHCLLTVCLTCLK